MEETKDIISMTVYCWVIILPVILAGLWFFGSTKLKSLLQDYYAKKNNESKVDTVNRPGEEQSNSQKIKTTEKTY
jgi:hypothetical protein